MAETGLALIVEDDEGVRFVLERALRAVGLQTVAVETVASGRDAVANHSFVCAFVDIRLPDGSGLDLAEEIANRRQRPCWQTPQSGTKPPHSTGLKHERSQRA